MAENPSNISPEVRHDIVEMLRAPDWWRGEYGGKEILCREAADEIERLREALCCLAGPAENGDHETAVPNDSPVTIRCQLGDLRRAWAALTKPEGE